jgi:hypothetical protein
MHAVTRLPSARILSDRIVDAGLFPPEALDMASALARHRNDQAISNPVLSQRFVCPAGTNEVEHILAERNPTVVLQHITGLTAHDAFEIRAAFHSVGSCSTNEPIDDLRRLGLIADHT